jgi:hypothetical protein
MLIHTRNHFGSIPDAQILIIMTSYLNKDFGKNPTGKEPRYLKLEAEVISQKITLSSDFIKNYENKK